MKTDHQATYEVRSHPKDHEDFLQELLHRPTESWSMGPGLFKGMVKDGEILLHRPYDARMIRLIEKTSASIIALYQVTFMNKYVAISVKGHRQA